MPKTTVVALPYDQAADTLLEATLLINTASLDANSGDLTRLQPLLHPALTVLDTTCGDGQTNLLTAAHDAGATALDGLSVLIEQTAQSIDLWLNAQGIKAKASREAMRAAFA
jgi:shikimate 5-dehydrogenase